VNYYTTLIKDGIDDKILKNSINGLRWSAEQSETIDFIVKVDEILQNCTSRKIRAELLDRKIYYLYKKENWSAAINTSKEIEILNSQHKNIHEIKLMKALCYENLGEYQNSVKVYEELYSKKHDSGVLRHWAKLLVKMNDINGAIDKLRKASMLTRSEDIWLELLEIELEQNSQYFENDYNKFMEFATGEEKENAQLIEIEWKLSNDNFEELNERVRALSTSKYKSVKAKVQLLKGLLLIKNGEDESAIPELLRLRYLYPEFNEIRNRAEALACLTYIEIDNYDEAKKLFEVIKKDIPVEMKEKLENLLSVEDK